MKCKIIRNDITNMNVEALVLPANPGLREGSGTSKAIFEKAGREQLVLACRKAKKEYGKISAGEAVLTPGFGLHARFIIHAVVPVWKGGMHQEYEQLASAYLMALKMADVVGCESIAFPLLGAGNNGFDSGLSFEIAEKCLESFQAKKKLRMAYLVVYDLKTMLMLQEQGISIEEQIDDDYLLKNDESRKFLVQKKLEETTGAVKNFAGIGIMEAKKYFGNPENRRHILEEGTRIVKTVLDAALSEEDMGSRQYVPDVETRDRILKPGDIVGVSRGIYEHYAVYIGNDEVIHYAGKTGDFGGEKTVHQAPFENFLRDSGQFFIRFFPDPSQRTGRVSECSDAASLKDIYAVLKSYNYHLFSPEETVERAKSKLGETSYNLALNNCENFAIWCKTGLSESSQVLEVLRLFMRLTGRVIFDPSKRYVF